VKGVVNVCRLLIIAGDCETICDVLLDIIPMLEEASAAPALAVIHSLSSDPKLLYVNDVRSHVMLIFKKWEFWNF